MTHGRKPRQARRISRAPIELATAVATRLTVLELAAYFDPVRAAVRALREGVGTEWDWVRVVSALNVAQAVEQLGVVRGLSGHLHSGELALQSINHRAMATGAWHSTELSFQEIEQVNAAVDFHEFQLQQLSYGEFRQAFRRAADEVRSTGGQVVDVDQLERMAA